MDKRAGVILSGGVGLKYPQVGETRELMGCSPTETRSRGPLFERHVLVIGNPGPVVQHLESAPWMRLECVHDFEEAKSRVSAQTAGLVLLGYGNDVSSDAARARDVLELGPIALITSKAIASSTLFQITQCGITCFSLQEVLDEPACVHAILAEVWPDARWLTGFCARWKLSPRESQIFISAFAGLGKIEVAEHLDCSARTIDTHWNRIFGKMGVRSAQGVLAAALRELLCCQARLAHDTVPLPQSPTASVNLLRIANQSMRD